MRFSTESYDKLFPRMEAAPEQIETAVEGFTPTADAIHEPAPQPEQVVTKQVVHDDPVPAPQPEPIKEISAEGEENGNTVNS